MQVLYRLLAHPDHLEPLREEVDAVIKDEGWTKAGVDKMYKIDSFLRETQRLDGISTCPLDAFSVIIRHTDVYARLPSRHESSCIASLEII